MAKPTIVTRAGKGSALTWTEGDANLTNLQNATITVTDGTNSKAIDLNGTITYTAGTNVTLSVNSSTGAVTINATQPTSVATLSTPRAIYGNNFDGSAALTQIIASTYGGTGNGFAKFSGPTTAEKTFTLPNSNATLLYDGGALGTPSSGTVTNLTGTASININGTVGATTANTGAFTTVSATTTTTSGALNITYTPSATSGAAIQTTGKDSQGGTGYFDFLKTTNTTSGATNASKTFRTNSTGELQVINNAYTATILALTDAGLLTVQSLSLNKDLRETVYTGGATTGTITPDCANGTTQKITLTGNITFNAFANAVAGQSMTLIITNSSGGGLTLTSTMKFSGASKTLSTGASAIDILTVFYDGSTYYASLAKGFA